MDTKDAQELMRRLYLDRDRDRGIEGTLLRTFQELSELTEAIMSKSSHEEITSEMADAFAWLCSVANLLDIDLSDALLSKYRNTCPRCLHSPCNCTDEP
ncbi:MAG: nucleotide pyrophosphohydrolase [Candidatus Thorarchaeota archaeon]|nr:nucleotide pyrophosphohydrolase [Candidatus Thorarchaeota archaeon]